MRAGQPALRVRRYPSVPTVERYALPIRRGQVLPVEVGDSGVLPTAQTVEGQPHRTVRAYRGGRRRRRGRRAIGLGGADDGGLDDVGSGAQCQCRRNGHGRHQDGHRTADPVAAPPDPTGALLDRGKVDRVAPDVLGADVQLPDQLVPVVTAHRSSSRSFASIGWVCTRSRIAASARLAWDFTVPAEMPRISATSASLRSS